MKGTREERRETVWASNASQSGQGPMPQQDYAIPYEPEGEGEIVTPDSQEEKKGFAR